jgi:hypothetical protein
LEKHILDKVDAFKKYATEWHIMSPSKNVIGFKKDGRWMAVGSSSLVNAIGTRFEKLETFTVVKSDGKFALKSHSNNKYLRADGHGLVYADRGETGSHEKFDIGCWGKRENKLTKANSILKV